jgi:hypothetical protein
LHGGGDFGDGFAHGGGDERVLVVDQGEHFGYGKAIDFQGARVASLGGGKVGIHRYLVYNPYRNIFSILSRL